MGILKRLFGKGREPRDPDALWLYVRCDYCGQKLKIRVDKRFEVQPDYERGGYQVNKSIMDGTCFSRMMARVHLDGGHRILSQEVEGGSLLTRAEFEREDR